MIRLILTFLLLTGCATTSTTEYAHVSTQLKPYVKRFARLYNRYCGEEMDKSVDVRLGVIESHPKAAGVYFRLFDYTVISQKYWQGKTPLMKEEVVFHELGHHVLGLGHDWGKDNVVAGCPASLMYFKGAMHCYAKKHDYYVEEMFKRAGCIEKSKQDPRNLYYEPRGKAGRR